MRTDKPQAVRVWFGLFAREKLVAANEQTAAVLRRLASQDGVLLCNRVDDTDALLPHIVVLARGGAGGA